MFDLNLNRQGIVDDYISVEIRQSYDSLGQLNMTIEGTKDILDLLQTDRILAKTTDISKGYIIKTREYLDEKSTELQIIAPSINVILNDRLVLGQQEFTGSIENVMKSFVQVNAVSPSNPNRIISNLAISASRGIEITTTESAVNKPLCDYLYEICKKHDVSFDVLLDHTNKKFIFDVWQGTDRSTLQDVNPHVIFAKDFDNVLVQNYSESISDLKTTAVVFNEDNVQREFINSVGESEKYTETIKTTIVVNDNLSGFHRKEIYLQSNLKRNYHDDYGNEVTLTEAQHRNQLTQDGLNTLSEHIAIRVFESKVDPLSNFVYGIDYYMGDKVSVRNDELGVILHTRIISVVEKANKQGETIQLNFGSNIPSFIEKVKRMVK